MKFDGDEVNVLNSLFESWNDVEWLANFFTSNKLDLENNFQITSVDKAIYDTLMDAEMLECLILDLAEDSDLDRMFRPLDNMRSSEFLASFLAEIICFATRKRRVPYNRWRY